MSKGAQVTVVVVLLVAAGAAGWYWYNNYGPGATGGAAPAGS